jgi:hypothetical protein
MYWVVSNMHLSGPFCCYMSHFCVMGTFCLCEDLSKEQFAHVIHWISPPSCLPGCHMNCACLLVRSTLKEVIVADEWPLLKYGVVVFVATSK